METFSKNFENPIFFLKRILDSKDKNPKSLKKGGEKSLTRALRAPGPKAPHVKGFNNEYEWIPITFWDEILPFGTFSVYEKML